MTMALREAWFATALAATGPDGVWIRLASPYLGAAADGDDAAILMPDLSEELIPWDRPGHEPAIRTSLLASVLMAVARLHVIGRRAPGDEQRAVVSRADRIGLLSRPAAERYQAEGNPVGDRFLAGWDAFDRHAPGPARALVAGLAADPDRLVAALGRLPPTMLHGDLKLSNVASLVDGSRSSTGRWRAWLRWRSSSAGSSSRTSPSCPRGPRRSSTATATSVDAVAADVGLDAGIGDWEAQVDLAFVIGLLLRGWRKGLDAEAGLILPTGVTAADDLGWWCDRALEAAARRL